MVRMSLVARIPSAPRELSSMSTHDESLLIRLVGCRRILDRRRDSVDLAAVQAGEVAVSSSIRINSTSTPSLAKKPFSWAMNRGPKPTQTVWAIRTGSA